MAILGSGGPAGGRPYEWDTVFPELDSGIYLLGQQGPGDYPEHIAQPGNFWLEEMDPPGAKVAREFRASLKTAAVVTAGYGGWSRVARPRRKALTDWIGRDSVSIQIDFFLNDFDEQRGSWIERACRTLESFAGVESNDPTPPTLELHSNPPGIIPHSYERATHVRWFVETLAWDQDDIRYNKNGNRIAASGSMTVTQYVKDERLKAIHRRQQAHRNPRGGRRKTYKVKRGDTLQKIAARRDVYHDASKWRKIAKANHIRDPKLGPAWWGKYLKIP